MFFIKDRSPVYLSWKLYEFGFDSISDLTNHEIELMQCAKKCYNYIPQVIEYKNDKLIVENIKGKFLIDYLIDTRDLSIFNKMETIINNFSSNYFWLKSNYINYLHDDRKNNGWLWYFDFKSDNFIIDKNSNIWFIDWDLAILNPNDLSKFQYQEFNKFKSDLIMSLNI